MIPISMFMLVYMDVVSERILGLPRGCGVGFSDLG